MSSELKLKFDCFVGKGCQEGKQSLAQVKTMHPDNMSRLTESVSNVQLGAESINEEQLKLEQEQQMNIEKVENKLQTLKKLQSEKFDQQIQELILKAKSKKNKGKKIFDKALQSLQGSAVVNKVTSLPQKEAVLKQSKSAVKQITSSNALKQKASLKNTKDNIVSKKVEKREIPAVKSTNVPTLEKKLVAPIIEKKVAPKP